MFFHRCRITKLGLQALNLFTSHSSTHEGPHVSPHCDSFLQEFLCFRIRTQSVGRYSYSAGLSLFEYEYQFIENECEYEGSRKDVGNDVMMRHLYNHPNHRIRLSVLVIAVWFFLEVPRVGSAVDHTRYRSSVFLNDA